MQIITGKLTRPLKTVLYGPEGIGKSTFASQMPNPLFIDTEGGTVNMDVARFQRPSSWTMLRQQVEYVKSNPIVCRTLVIDTADWAERLCIEHICSAAKVKGLEDFGYGKGYIYLEEEYGRLLNQLQDLIEIGIHVTITAHAEIKKIEQPEEIGGYDHWQMKLEKKTMPLLKEWADILLFANYQVHVVNVDNQGAQKGKNKARGGSRVMYTTHTPWWDGKNRHGLQDELNFDFTEVAHLYGSPGKEMVEPEPIPAPEPARATQPEVAPPKPDMPTTSATKDPLTALRDLMALKMYSDEDVRRVVGQKGYYTFNTPIEKYDPDFIAGVLVGAWDQVSGMIDKNIEEETPF